MTPEERAAEPNAARVALITGGTDGIGRATAEALLRQGWRVCIVGRNHERCARAVAELASSTGNSAVTSITADLSLLSDTRRASEEFAADHERLEFLFLNANAITQTRVLTTEGLESNLALGFLSRVVMAECLETLTAATPGAQILTVVGLNLSRLDFDDLTMAQKFSGQEALGRWQWAMQVWCREFNERQSTPMNVFMPGLVKTKILDTEPGRLQRTIIKAVMPFVAVSPEQSAQQVLAALANASDTEARDAYYPKGKPKGRRDLKELPGDGDRAWELARVLTTEPPTAAS